MSAVLREDVFRLDIDCRVRRFWEIADDGGHLDDWPLDLVAKAVRAAYEQGYRDALTEPVSGSLYRDHGYRIPTRRAA